MPSPSMSNLLAQASGTGVSPMIRKRLGELLVQQPDTAAAVPASGIPGAVNLLQGPAAAPTRTYNGNMGRTLLEDPQGAVSPQEPARPKVRGFEETAGGKMAMALLEKRKNLKWFTPDFVANRNERDMAQAIDLAKAEMGGSEGQDVSSQRWANLLEGRAAREARAAETQASLTQAADERKARMKHEADRLALDRDRLVASVNESGEENKDRDAERAFKERVYNAGRGAEEVRGKSAASAPLYDPTASDPGATGVFANYAAKLLKDNSMLDVQDVPAEQVKASRLGILPKMMSTPADRPAGAMGPPAGSALNTTFRRDPRTGKLVRVP